MTRDGHWFLSDIPNTSTKTTILLYLLKPMYMIIWRGCYNNIGICIIGIRMIFDRRIKILSKVFQEIALKPFHNKHYDLELKWLHDTGIHHKKIWIKTLQIFRRMNQLITHRNRVQSIQYYFSNLICYCKLSPTNVKSDLLNSL